MKNLHTPGPWEIRYLSGIDMEITSKEGKICSFNGYSHSSELMEENEEQERANARLIAAAPEMLKTLEEVLIDLNSNQIETARRRLKAAIQKATN